MASVELMVMVVMAVLLLVIVFLFLMIRRSILGFHEGYEKRR
ncbi:MAG: hypothetical protein ACLFMX_00950 [Halobacteriales archaeon]